jgi:hypothetical protein
MSCREGFVAPATQQSMLDELTALVVNSAYFLPQPTARMQYLWTKVQPNVPADGFVASYMVVANRMMPPSGRTSTIKWYTWLILSFTILFILIIGMIAMAKVL